MAADVEPEDLLRLLLRVGGVVGELDPARLAAPAGQHLRLDDDLAAELLGRGARLLRRRRGPSLRDRDAEALEELLALILVEVQSGRDSSCVDWPECAGPSLLALRSLSRGCGGRRGRRADPGRRARPSRSAPSSTGARPTPPRSASGSSSRSATLEVTPDGWSATVAVTNRTALPLRDRHGPGRLRLRPDALSDRRPEGGRGGEPRGRCPRPARATDRAAAAARPRAGRDLARDAERPGIARRRELRSASSSAPSAGWRTRPEEFARVVWFTDRSRTSCSAL